MEASDVVLLVLAALLIPFAALCAAADSAITMVSSARVEELEREGKRGATSLQTIIEDRPRFTNLLLLLRVGAETTSVVLVSAVALSIWGFNVWIGAAVAAVMILISYVIIGVFPRTIGRQHPYVVGVIAAGPTRALSTILGPVANMLIKLGNSITPGKGFREGPFSSEIELRELVDLAGDNGVVEETEREMLQSVFALGDTIAREVMVPRTEVVWIEQNKSLRQALHLADISGMSRIPVIGENVDDILGVIYLKDMIHHALVAAQGAASPALVDLMRPAQFVPESKNVDALLREMQLQRNHFAVVVDEYGGAAGILTIEDILEEIVGEITDEYDAETPAPIEHLGDDRVRVSAKLPVEDLGEIFDVQLPTDEVETVGGLLAQLIGRVPLAGSEATIEGLHLLGEAGFDRRGRPRVQSILVHQIVDEDEDDPSADEPDESDEDSSDAVDADVEIRGRSDQGKKNSKKQDAETGEVPDAGEPVTVEKQRKKKALSV